MVQLLDAATLALLHTFHPPSDWLGSRPLLSFSPGSHSLVLYTRGRIIAWDLKTGGKAADFPAECKGGSSSTYSTDGELFAILSEDRLDDHFHLTIYDLRLETRTGYVGALTGRVALPIWTHGECIRFATVRNQTITISEVGFTSTHDPVEVKSLPVPDRVARSQHFLFLPALSRLAFVLPRAIEVWDARRSRTLLKRVEDDVSTMSFSTDGHFFAYVANRGQVHVWEVSANGYELHQQLPSPSLTVGNLVLSPSGRSIIMASESIYLLSTVGPIPSLPNTSAQFALAFSPEETLATIARKTGNTITVVNLESGDRRPIIETGRGIRALGVTGGSLIAVCDENILTWTIPTGNRVFNAQKHANGNVRVTILDQPGLSPDDLFGSQSISPVHNRIAVAGSGNPGYLRIYDISTGEYLGGIKAREVGTPRFTPDGCEVWVVNPSSMEGWATVGDEGTGLIRLEPLESTACPPGVVPWRSSRGHYVHDGWILNSAQERILWLPHRWRSGESDREWGGRFLGLLHRELPEAVILELCD